MLNVTAGHLAAVVDRLATLDEEAFHRLSDTELFQVLDRALYLDDDRADAEVRADAERYARLSRAAFTSAAEAFLHWLETEAAGMGASTGTSS